MAPLPRRAFLPVLAVLAVVVALGGSLLARPGSAQASPADAPTYVVTMVARECPSYESIMANLARNNIQQSLRDLGKDSVYRPGQPISPVIEEPNQPLCRALNGWKFQLGANGGGPAVDNLSTVGGAGRVTDTTSTVPLLDDDAAPTGQTITGAVNVQLTPAEYSAAQRQALWVQGGTTDDPLLYSTPVNSRRTLGFGALRCAVDNLNGDNVEWIGFPSSVNRVFCYYYTVSNAPLDGTIVVRKELAPSSERSTATFAFNGNISYVPSGDFSVTVQNGQPGEAKFVRAAGDTWDFSELSNPVWAPDGPPDCTSRDGTSTFDVNESQVKVTLGPGDLATCTYTNQRRSTGELGLFKQTAGAIGTFPFMIDRPDGSTDSVSVQTTSQDEPTEVTSAPSGPAGTWLGTEKLPNPQPGGRWDLDQVLCNNKVVPYTIDGQERSVSLDISAAQNLGCTVYNRFTPAGEIRISKTTVGGTGAFRFVVRDLDATLPDDGIIGVATATTTAENEPVVATGADLTGLPVSRTVGGREQDGRRYLITELAPPDSPAGSWSLTSVGCNGGGLTAEFGLSLTLQDPLADCHFTNTFVPAAHVSLVKQLSGDTDARTGPVRVDLSCADLGTRQLVGPSGQDGPFRLEPDSLVQFPAVNAATSCTAREVDDGAPAGIGVHTAILVSVNGQDRPAVDSTHATFPVRPGDAVQVVVLDRYNRPLPPPTPPPTSPPPTPPSTPTPTPTNPHPSTPGGSGGSSSGTGGSGGLAGTGLGASVVPLCVLGAALLVLGTVVIRRRRH